MTLTITTQNTQKEVSFPGEIKLFGGTVAPAGWEFCRGELLLIADHTELFAVIGTTFGGDGVTNFALPDLENRFPLGTSDIQSLGTVGGNHFATLTPDNLPAHTHNVRLGINTETSNSGEAGGNVLGEAAANIYNNELAEAGEFLGGLEEDTVGNCTPLNIQNSFVSLNYIIALI